MRLKSQFQKNIKLPNWSPITLLGGRRLPIGSRELYDAYRANVAYQYSLPVMIFTISLDAVFTVLSFPLQFEGVATFFATGTDSPYLQIMRTVACLVLVLLSMYLSKYLKKIWPVVAFLSIVTLSPHLMFYLDVWTVFPPYLLMLVMETIHFQQSFLMSLALYVITTVVVLTQLTYPAAEVETVQKVSSPVFK